MIILHFHLQPQFIDELFRIYITSLLCFCFFILSIYTCIRRYVLYIIQFSFWTEPGLWMRRLIRMQLSIIKLTLPVQKYCLPYCFYWSIYPDVLQTLSRPLPIHTFCACVCQRTPLPAMRPRTWLCIRHHTPVAMQLRATKKHNSEGLGQNYLFLNPQMDSIQKFVL